MERLTQNNFDYCLEMCEPECMHECSFYKDDQESKCPTAAMYDRLAAYEETNWSPDDIREAFSLIRYASDLVNGNISYNHLREILAADQEGRLVVLPCKVGKHLYAATRNIISEFEVKGFELDGSGMVWVTWEVVSGMYGHFRIDGIPDDAIGKTVFLTRAEAEAAMKGVSDSE